MSQYNFAHCLSDGIGTEPNEELGFSWCEKAAEAGDADALNKLGTLYELGIWVKQNDVRTYKYYNLASRKGCVNASFNLARYCTEGVYDSGRLVVQPDLPKAARLYEIAAKSGRAMAQNDYAYMLEYGEGVAQDSEQAANWYQAAAEQGNANAKFNLARLYYIGEGVEQDTARAKVLYMEAAEAGIEGAAKELVKLTNTEEDDQF